MAAELLILRGQEHEPAVGEAERNSREEGRKDSSHPAGVEVGVAEGVFTLGLIDDAADEVAGDDEEHVDADKPARQIGRAGVKGDDGQYGDGPQAVDVSSVFDCRHDGLECILEGLATSLRQPHGPLDGGLVDKNQFERPPLHRLAHRLADAVMTMGRVGLPIVAGDNAPGPHLSP